MKLAMITFAGLAGLAACTDPVVSLTLELPAQESVADVDLSCVSSVFVIADGKDRGHYALNEQDVDTPPDDNRTCIPVSGATSFADLQAKIRDQVELSIPKSGLAGIEVFGSTGDCEVGGLTMFYGSRAYIGQDTVSIPITPFASCKARQVTVHPVDLLALTASPDHSCPADVSPDVGPAIWSSTLRDTLLDGVVEALAPDVPVTGQMSIEKLDSVPNSLSCIAAFYTDADTRAELATNQLPESGLISDTCLRDAPSVCTPPGQYELPIISGAVASSLVGGSPNPDYYYSIVGAVWGADATGKMVPLPGATVDIGPDQGVLVYADLATDPGYAIHLDTNATSIKSSGLFVVYANHMVDVTVHAAGYRDQQLHLMPFYGTSTALVAMQKN